MDYVRQRWEYSGTKASNLNEMRKLWKRETQKGMRDGDGKHGIDNGKEGWRLETWE